MPAAFDVSLRHDKYAEAELIEPHLPPTFTDLLASTNVSSPFSQINIAGAFNTTGLFAIPPDDESTAAMPLPETRAGTTSHYPYRQNLSVARADWSGIALSLIDGSACPPRNVDHQLPAARPSSDLVTANP